MSLKYWRYDALVSSVVQYVWSIILKELPAESGWLGSFLYTLIVAVIVLKQMNINWNRPSITSLVADYTNIYRSSNKQCLCCILCLVFLVRHKHLFYRRKMM